MKKFLLLLILNSAFSFHNSFSQSPNWLWAKGMGGTSHDYSSSITVDASGSVYTTGTFMGTVDFDPGAGTFNLTSTGQGDIFISKLDSSGNFVWAKAIGGTYNDEATSIAIDSAGGVAIYTTGNFEGTVDFDPGAGTFNLTSTGQGDIFISKLDSSGNFVWAKAIGGTNDDRGFSIAIDPAGSGNVYTTGNFEGTVDFDPGMAIFNLTMAGAWDIFISKLDSSGNFVWAKAMGGTVGYDYGYSIAIDPAGSGDIYTTGIFEDTADFDPGVGVFNLTSAGQWDIYISKLDSSGNFVWAKAFGGTSEERGYSLAIDPAGGYVYTIGYFGGTVDFDPDSSGSFNLTSAGGSRDIFISKLDGSGNFIWAKAMGGISYDYGNSIAIDLTGGGGVYTTGYFSGTADFDPGAGTFNLTSVGGEAVFVSKLDSSGNFVWAKAAGGISNGARGIAVALDAPGNVYVTGIFFNPITIGSTTLTNAGGVYSDIFIARIEAGVVTGINEQENFGKGVLVFPNLFTNTTTISFSLSQSQKVSLRIFDMNGRLVATLADKIFAAGENQIVWNAENVNAGIYFLQFQAPGNLQSDSYRTEKLIVTKL